MKRHLRHGPGPSCYELAKGFSKSKKHSFFQTKPTNKQNESFLLHQKLFARFIMHS